MKVVKIPAAAPWWRMPASTARYGAWPTRERRVVVVSAAGKRFGNDHKLTDLLYLCYAHVQYGVDCSNIFDMIAFRYLDIR